MSYAETDLLPISALQHLLFCPRQCALIHNEQLWADNHLTAQGQVLHERAHTPKHESRPGVRITRSLYLSSRVLGLRGIADIIEFHRDGTIIPVEYKRGKPKSNDCDRIQLCAQAMCLEEMRQSTIPAGALYYGQRRRRTEVVFDDSLRARTTEAARELHQLIRSRRTPAAVREPKCDACSLIDLCLPDALAHQSDTTSWFVRRLQASLKSQI
ncbi:CRISPR-associated protein Cas4 [Synoicihabitans lomoniglobus]|uniref:CRISPR-associated exonuclease Cas4 n=1 Tax=Synoicihabitans lomoniglobus TaxID=2909285 RepID=A0AAF0A152_9BACT|nr:CRISPR-associated protein Cas4 [Opitutaceae bacterium LMO-M01]WED64747.1 CRISPR-associated protein Cas4 [Opitutaceae bacterium LMO-M01]